MNLRILSLLFLLLSSFGLNSCGSLKKEHTEKVTLNLNLNYDTGKITSRTMSKVSGSILGKIQTHYIMVLPASATFPVSYQEWSALVPHAEGILSGNSIRLTIPRNTPVKIFAFLYEKNHGSLSQLKSLFRPKSQLWFDFWGSSNDFSVTSSARTQAVTVLLKNARGNTGGGLQRCQTDWLYEVDSNNDGTVETQQTQTSTYDSYGKELTRLKTDNSSSYYSDWSERTEWTYDNSGYNLTQLRTTNYGDQYGGTQVNKYSFTNEPTYDAGGYVVSEKRKRIQEQHHKSGTWTSDSSDNITGIVTRTYNDQGWEISYLSEDTGSTSDAYHTSSTYTKREKRRYTYDTRGNQLTQKSSVSTSTPETGSGTYTSTSTSTWSSTWTYDNEDNMLTELHTSSFSSGYSTTSTQSTTSTNKNERKTTWTYDTNGKWVTRIDIESSTSIDSNGNTSNGSGGTRTRTRTRDEYGKWITEINEYQPTGTGNTTNTRSKRTLSRTYDSDGYPLKSISEVDNNADQSIDSKEMTTYTHAKCGVTAQRTSALAAQRRTPSAQNILRNVPLP